MLMQIHDSQMLIKNLLGGHGQKWVWPFWSWDSKFEYISKPNRWNNLIFRMLVQTFPWPDTSPMGKCPSGMCLVGEMSVGEVYIGEESVGEMSVGHVSRNHSSFWRIYRGEAGRGPFWSPLPTVSIKYVLDRVKRVDKIFAVTILVVCNINKK